MAEKLPGIRTGTVDSFTDSGQHVRWVPKSELVMVDGGQCDLPRRISANPNSRQGYAEFSRKEPGVVRDGARLFVGFNVGGDEVWRAGEVYLAAYLLRQEQLRGKRGAPAFTFYVGIGAYPGDKVVASERSAQIVFMNFGQSSKAFFKDMFDLSATLAEELSQESILLELQEDGHVTYLDYIDSDRKHIAEIDDTRSWLNENKHCIQQSVWRMK